MNQFDISHLRQPQIDRIQREAVRLRARVLRESIASLGRAIARVLNGVGLTVGGQTAR